jgi:DNA-binding MarR family transcriptional regulator
MPARPTTPAHHLPLLESAEELKLRTWVQLARTFYLVQRRIVSTLSAHGLTLPQFDVLATLRFSEGVTQQELAHRLLVTKGNVCGVIDRLEATRRVERRPDPADRRANRLHLTPAGKRKIDSVLPDHDALVLVAMRTVSPADARTLRALLEKVAAACESA